MQSKYMKEALQQFGDRGFDDLLNALLLYNFQPELTISPFCVEYELYAHWMMHHHPTKVRLLRWGNIGLNSAKVISENEKLEFKDLRGFNFASVSLHDYIAVDPRDLR